MAIGHMTAVEDLRVLSVAALLVVVLVHGAAPGDHCTLVGELLY